MCFFKKMDLVIRQLIAVYSLPLIPMVANMMFVAGWNSLSPGEAP
jgi:hypothetical protein